MPPVPTATPPWASFPFDQASRDQHSHVSAQLSEALRDKESAERAVKHADEDRGRHAAELKESKDEVMRLSVELRTTQAQMATADKELTRMQRSFSVAEEKLSHQMAKNKQLEDENDALVCGRVEEAAGWGGAA